MDQQAFRFTRVVLPFACACFALSPIAQAAGPARLYPGFSTAAGEQALPSVTSGVWNTALGGRALFHDTEGACNVASGNAALLQNTTGTDNTANGVYALRENTTGGGNVALGYCAGLNLTTGNNNIDISNIGVAGESRTIRIGADQNRAFIAGIRGITTANADAVPVVIDSAGQLGTTSSSERFKRNIQPMNESSNSLFQLEPVTFSYKADAKNRLQYGLIAEQVARVKPDLVVRDAQGDIYTVRYDAINAMLLNEFLKEHKRVQELGASDADQKKEIAELRSTIAQQQKAMASLVAQMKEQNAKIDKVSAQVVTSRVAAQVVQKR